uniref:MYND-type domain-containing protein n=1 Tax=Biomphalaria glabrata TaxID=6526 RepID=A0A2C9KW51_BIOGL
MGWKRGTVVMESKPFAHVICQKFSEDRCNYCLKRCFRSTHSHREDWKIHKTECKIMKRVPNVPTDSIRLFLRLIIRFLKGDGKQKHPNDESPCIRTFNDLMSHRDEIKADQTRSELFRIAADFVRGYTHGILQLPSDDVLLEIFGKVIVLYLTCKHLRLSVSKK